MGVLGYKLFRDLWNNKGRTIQVILIIGLSAGSIGMIMGTRNLMIPSMQEIWKSQVPAMINLYTPFLGEDDLQVLEDVDGVAVIEGKSSTYVEWRSNPEEEWQQATLSSRIDYENQILNKLELLNGDWPHDEILALGQDAEAFFGVSSDEEIIIRVNDREIKVNFIGTVYDQLIQPAYFGGMLQLYTTNDNFDELVGVEGFNQILVSAPEYEEGAVTDLANRLQERLEKQGYDSNRMIIDPDEHIFEPQMDGIFLVLTILGFVSLGLGLLLVYNTINVLVTQQVNQIGVMKAVGASTWHILRLFFVSVFIYGFLALLLALPLAIYGAWSITTWLSNNFGADIGSFQVSQPVIIQVVLICLVAPLLSSVIPIISGARITVREAISTFGLSTNTGLIERALRRVRFISRLILITISNTFRHKRRVIFLEFGLVLSGLMFMAVVAVREAVEYTTRDVFFSILNADITLVFETPQRFNYIEDLTLIHPEVKALEMWGLANPTIRPAGQPASEDDESISLLFGVPLPTQLFGSKMLAGRWLDPNDSYALVLDKQLAEEIGVGVGDWVTLTYAEHEERDWQIVGLSFLPFIPNTASAPRDVLLYDLGFVGRGQSVWIQTWETDPQRQIAIAKNLREFYEQNNVKISAVRGVFSMGDTTGEMATTIIGQINFLVILLGVMAMIIGAVGGIALSGALSLSVMERRREIGVMRAIGASSWTIFRLFIGEGLILGWLSWLFAFPLSIPVGRLMSQAIGSALETEFFYNFSTTGPVMWLGIITILSILASWLPARGATKISVRESLAYQ
ncbi:MAG: FtsX-like permease family protein [Anaerolineales bacterium]|nr:MAG: FtsX-like permease family protein [Anaerolineales bacterium]